MMTRAGGWLFAVELFCEGGAAERRSQVDTRKGDRSPSKIKERGPRGLDARGMDDLCHRNEKMLQGWAADTFGTLDGTVESVRHSLPVT
eukprot:759988-Prorocentrum_minimum.AAC.1